MTTSIAEQVQGAAALHKFLLDRLTELEDASSSLVSHRKYLAGLSADLDKSEMMIKKLDAKTSVERKEYEDIRSSVARRFLARTTGQKKKFEAREAKEEREYVEALEKEIKEKDRANTLRMLIQDAEKVLVEIEGKVAEYDRREKELHDLYSRVFDGPTAEYPQDDILEGNVDKAKEEYSAVQTQYHVEQKAADLLSQACQSMNACRSQINTALGFSHYDMWGGGTFADAMERSALAKAQRLGSLAQILLAKASALSPRINTNALNGLYIAQGSIMSDVIFDNVFTDMAFHGKIKDSMASANHASTLLHYEQTGAAERSAALFRSCEAAKKNLATRREELDRFRQSVFEGTADKNGGNIDTMTSSQHPSYAPPEGPPPGYQQQITIAS